MEANEVSQMLKKILKVDRTGNYRPVAVERPDEMLHGLTQQGDTITYRAVQGHTGPSAVA